MVRIPGKTALRRLTLAAASTVSGAAISATADQSGVEGKVKVYDFGGNKWAFEAVKPGQIEATRMMTPYEEMYKGVEALARAWKGEKADRFIPLVTADVTKENIDQFKPEY